MEELITIISTVGAVLGVILFFKVWGACNDIKKLRDHFCPQDKRINPDILSVDEAQRIYEEQNKPDDIVTYYKQKHKN